MVSRFSTEFNFSLLVSPAQGTPGMAPPPAPATASASAGTTNTATTAGPAPGGPAQPPPPQPSAADLQFSQLLGNLLGPAGPGAGGPGMASPTITVAMPGVPAFLQGMTDFLQVSCWLALWLPPTPAGPARCWCLVSVMLLLGYGPWWPVDGREPWDLIDSDSPPIPIWEKQQLRL